MAMDEHPFFTIVIPVVSINSYVRETVVHLRNQVEPSWELIVLPNGDDVNEWVDDRRIRVIPSGRVGPAAKRDLASKNRRGQILVFLDDDSYPEADFLERLRVYFCDTSISAIGGPGLTPLSDTFWQKVSGSVYLTKITGGNPKRYRSIGTMTDVDDWPSVNLSVRADAFDSVGGFNTEFWPGEDTFLCWKLSGAGLRIAYAPDVIVWHHRRSGFRRHMRQVGAYGLHRGYFARKYPESSRRFKYFIPSFAMFAIFGSVLLWSISTMYLPVLTAVHVMYLGAVVCGALEIAWRTNWRIAFCALPYIISTHICYGLSFARGFFLTRRLVSQLR